VKNDQLKPGYKQTAMGLVPKDWNVQDVQSLGNIKTGPFGTLLKASEYSESDGVPLISIREIRDGKLQIDESTPLVPLFVVRRLPEYVLNDGDIVFGRKGAVDRTALVTEKQSGWFLGSDGIRIRLSNKLHSPFIAWQFRRKEIQAWLLQNATGTTMASLNQEILRRISLPIPPLLEQRSIAQALSDVDALIAELDKAIDKKRVIKTATMQQLLTGKKRLSGFGEGQGYKQTEVGVIPEDWLLTPLEKISAFITKGSTPTTYGFSWVQEGILFLRSECVSENGLDLLQSMFISHKAHTVLVRGESRSGDILITITGNVGRVVYLSDDFGICNINQHIARIRINNDSVYSEFVYHFLTQNSVRKFFSTITTGQAYPQISLKQVRDAIIPLPLLLEQRAIATVLSDMDAEITALETRLAKTQAIKQGMMQELLTGRTRLVRASEVHRLASKAYG
jgi:type I restriction enzyme S subunit